MLDPKTLDDLTQRLAVGLPKGLQAMQNDLRKGLRASLEAGLSRLDLVSREEFDVQCAVLGRTRQRLEAMEARIQELEQQLATVQSTPTDRD